MSRAPRWHDRTDWKKRRLHFEVSRRIRISGSLFRAVEDCTHPLERDHPIALFDQALDQPPIEGTIRPEADPSALAIRRNKESFSTKQQVDIYWIQPERNGSPPETTTPMTRPFATRFVGHGPFPGSSGLHLDHAQSSRRGPPSRPRLLLQG